MNLSGKFFPRILGVSIGFALSASSLFADDLVGSDRKAALEQIETVEMEALFKEAELVKKYVAALDALEKKLAAEGNLDTIVRLREERDSVMGGGKTTSHEDKPLAELREKYTGALKVIRTELAAGRNKIATDVTQKLREQEGALTKAGKVDEALALRKEGERLLLELSAGTGTEEVKFEDDPRSTTPVDLTPLDSITIPKEKPPLYEKPFAIKGRWLESMTLPASKRRIGEPIVIGDRMKKQWPSVVLSPGTVWSGSDGGRLDVSAGNFLASKVSFESLPIAADLACKFYFQNCAFSDCAFGKGGVWYGSSQAAKFYFENCIVNKNLSSRIDIVDHGFRAQTSVFQKVDFPSVSFRKQQPADFLNHPWMRFVNCRFVDCRIPASFALLTRDCIFDNCSFEDDDKLAAATRPTDVVLYVNNCKWRITKLPGNITLTQKPDTEWKGPQIPTAESLTSLMGL